MALQEEPEPQQEGDGQETPFDELAERVSDTRERFDDVWDAFDEQAAANGHFLRGGSSDATETPPPSSDAEPTTEVLGRERQTGQLEEISWDDGDTVIGDTGKPNNPTETLRDAQGEPSLDEGDQAIFEQEDEQLELDGVERVDADGREFVVPKRSYCEQCPHLSDPPEMRCANDDTDIIEFVDINRVRVRNCPVVEERQSPDEVR